MPGELFVAGGAQRFEPQEKYASMIRALDPRTVETKWEYPLQAKTQSGLVSTDLIFGGSVDGYFYALDATDGKELWRMSVGGQVKAAPMTYMASGKQYVTIAAGNAVVTFGLE